MGTYFANGASKQEIIKICTQDWDRMPVAKGTCLAKRCVGNQLWSVWEQFSDGETTQFITLFLLTKYEGEWGYRPIDEIEGPDYHKCPLKYLDMAGDGMNNNWRDNVRHYWKARETYKNLFVGIKVILKNCLIKSITISHKHGRNWVGLADDGQYYKIKPEHIKELATT